MATGAASRGVGVEPAEIIDLAVDGTTVGLVDRFCGSARTGEFFNQRKVLTAVLSRAVAAGARTAVIERRYIDVDYRDEHSLFYAKTFRQYPASTHRIHFFAEDAPSAVFDVHVAASFDGMTYLGYSVIRPIPGAAVGRTMIAPEFSKLSSVTCLATDRVNFFGHEYEITAAPFMAQDNQLGVCAHAASWMVGYFYTLRYGHRRLLPGDIAASVQHALTLGRRVPNRGLATEQLSDILEEVGLPAIVYRTTGSPASTRDHDRIMRRYLDSSIPVIVGTLSHTFVAVGYEAQPGGYTKFVCQDDEAGPYRVYRRPASPKAPDAWQYLIVPAPEQLYVTSEEAEIIGRTRLAAELESPCPRDHPDPERVDAARQELLTHLRPSRHGDESLGFVTSAVESNEFKRSLESRGYSHRVARAYMRIPMSKWVWVVELVNRKSFDSKVPSVLGEAVIDSTCHRRDLQVLAWRVSGSVQHWEPDTDELGDLIVPEVQNPALSICATTGLREVRRR